jgi:citronellol/citronellal dehydrogenase
MTFSGKTVFITGASRGIGKAIALKLASEGANIVIAAKTAHPHPRLEGTIYTAASEIEEAGGKALPLEVDVRSEEMIVAGVAKAVETFGGIDILINNASAINLSPTAAISAKAFDLMQQVNGRATFLVSQQCIPFLKKSSNPHILTLSPPLNMQQSWFSQHLAYTISKYTMSMCVLGLAGELKKEGIAVNALWPKTLIATAAVQNLLGGDEIVRKSRHPRIVADAAYHILRRPAAGCSGNFFIDEEVLEAEGVVDFSAYSVVPGGQLIPDLFL